MVREAAPSIVGDITTTNGENETLERSPGAPGAGRVGPGGAVSSRAVSPWALRARCARAGGAERQYRCDSPLPGFGLGFACCLFYEWEPLGVRGKALKIKYVIEGIFEHMIPSCGFLDVSQAECRTPRQARR